MAGNIGIGDLDTLVTVQRCEITTGDRGQKVYDWQCCRNVYAHVDRTVGEQVADGNLEQGQSLTLTMYKIDGLSTRWRVLVDGVPYAIEGIDPLGRISPLCEVSVRSIE